MSGPRRLAALALPLICTIGCTPSLRVARPTRGQELFVLLPGASGDHAGRARVTSRGNSVELVKERSATILSDGPLTIPSSISRSDLQNVFGDALGALPPPPRLFNLYFDFDSVALTDQSRAQVPEILRAVSERPGAEVVVVGHTDTMGARSLNFEVGLRRAQIVRGLLTQAGLRAALIEVESSGEGDPLVSTPDQTPEPRNRRVEISVK